MARFTSVNQPNGSHKTKAKGRRKARTAQIGIMQDVLLEGIQGAGTDKLSTVSSAVNAWCTSEALRREMVGLGKPKPVEPVNASKASKRKPAIPLGPSKP